MTPEQRLDRLERIAKLMVRAGLRARQNAREQQDKINIIIDAQVRNEQRFENLVLSHAEQAEVQAEQGDKIDTIINAQIKNEERFAKMAEAQTELAKAQTGLAQSQSHTDRRLDALIDIIREGRNGKSTS